MAACGWVNASVAASAIASTRAVVALIALGKESLYFLPMENVVFRGIFAVLVTSEHFCRLGTAAAIQGKCGRNMVQPTLSSPVMWRDSNDSSTSGSGGDGGVCGVCG